METKRRENWRAFLIEAIVIVGSILLAFAIDAWWQEREERRIETTLLNNLRSDMLASQEQLEQWITGNSRILDSAEGFLSLLRAAQRDSEVSVPFRNVVGVLGTPTYSPTESTINAAVSSGQIELIANPRIRAALASWQYQLEDTRADELYRRDITRTQLLPALSAQTRLGDAFTQHLAFFLEGRVTDPDRLIRLTASSDLEGALGHFVFYTHFIVEQLEQIGETQSRILEMLEQP